MDVQGAFALTWFVCFCGTKNTKVRDLSVITRAGSNLPVPIGVVSVTQFSAVEEWTSPPENEVTFKILMQSTQEELINRLANVFSVSGIKSLIFRVVLEALRQGLFISYSMHFKA